MASLCSDPGPRTPKYKDGKLYDCGSADDGYAVCANIAAVQALKSQEVNATIFRNVSWQAMNQTDSCYHLCTISVGSSTIPRHR